MGAALSPRTRLLVLSHVSYCTGAALPLAELCALASERGILTLVDGAQAAGAVPLDLQALGIDFYAIPGQKWLLGPEDTGALYVRRQRLDTLQQVFAGFASMAQQAYGGPLLAHPDARRYEVGLRSTPALFGQAAAVEWLRDRVGLDWAQARIRRLTEQAREALGQQPNVKVLTPDNAGGLLMFAVDGLAADTVVAELAKVGIIVRSVNVPDCVRASFGFYNTEAEVRRLAAALGSLRPN